MGSSELAPIQIPDGTEEIITSWAEKIVALGLETPAVFFLELHKPISTIVHTGTLMLAPVAAPLFGAQRIKSAEIIFSDRENIERLIQKIECLVKE